MNLNTSSPPEVRCSKCGALLFVGLTPWGIPPQALASHVCNPPPVNETQWPNKPCHPLAIHDRFVPIGLPRKP